MNLRFARRTIMAWATGGVVLFGLTTRIVAQSAPPNFRDAIDYPSLLRQLRSPLDTVRAAAYYSLLFEPTSGAYDGAARVQHLLVARPKLAPQLRRDLVATLARENSLLVRHVPRVLPPPYTQYFVHLVASVAALHDAAATSALIGALPNVAAQSGLVAIGTAAVPRLKIASASKDSTVAASARRVLGQIEATRR